MKLEAMKKDDFYRQMFKLTIPIIIQNLLSAAVNSAAVIDKDLAGAKLAELIDADVFLILTDVSHAKLNYGKPDEQNVGEVSLATSS